MFLLTQDLESPSGLGRYWPLAKELSRLGHEVMILALHSNYEKLSLLEKSFVRERVKVHYVGQMHVRKIGTGKQYFSSPRLLWVVIYGTMALLINALKSRADVFHIGKPHPMNGLAGLIASIVCHRALYLDCDDYEAVSNHISGAWQKKGLALFEDILPKLVNGITTNTHFTHARLRALGVSNERIVYVPNGVDRQRFMGVKKETVAILRDRLSLNERKIVLYVGSLSLSSHAVDLLLEAFAIVRQRELLANLLLVGGGEDYDVLKQQTVALGINNSVIFVGRVSPDEVPAYYKLADVSVEPVRDSEAEKARSPLKIVESLVAGTPVVTGDVGDRLSQLARGGGIITSPGDASALADALVAILQDDILCIQLKAEALAICENYYWDRLVHDFVSVYA